MVQATLTQKNPSQKKKKKERKRAGGVTQGVGPEFKPQYGKQKNMYILYTYIYICIYIYLYIYKTKLGHGPSVRTPA
jgi:hypothetical protein